MPIIGLEKLLTDRTQFELEFIREEARLIEEAHRLLRVIIDKVLFEDNSTGTHRSASSLVNILNSGSEGGITPSQKLQRGSKSNPFDYRKVARTASKIYQKHKAVSTPDVQIELGTAKYGKSIGQQVNIWASKLGLNSEVNNNSGLYKSRSVYFNGKKRPKLLGEKVYEYIKSREIVSHAAIQRLTWLSDLGVKTLMVRYLDYKQQGTKENIRYIIV